MMQHFFHSEMLVQFQYVFNLLCHSILNTSCESIVFYYSLLITITINIQHLKASKSETLCLDFFPPNSSYEPYREPKLHILSEQEKNDPSARYAFNIRGFQVSRIRSIAQESHHVSAQILSEKSRRPADSSRYPRGNLFRDCRSKIHGLRRRG